MDATQNVLLWINNDENLYSETRDLSATTLKDLLSEVWEVEHPAGTTLYLTPDGFDLNDVDWDKIEEDCKETPDCEDCNNRASECDCEICNYCDYKEDECTCYTCDECLEKVDECECPICECGKKDQHCICPSCEHCLVLKKNCECEKEEEGFCDKPEDEKEL